MPPLIKLVGQSFGKLTVLERGGTTNGHVKWNCKCQCGNECSVSSGKLRTGHTKSCGCFKIDATKAYLTTHGKSHVSAYASWHGMLRRCFNKKSKCYDRYGGRGITVCERWLKFENFYIDMGDKPPKLTLERKNNDEDYNKKNCCWDTRKAQIRNRSCNKITLVKAILIIKMRNAGVPQNEVALKFKISVAHVRSIVKGTRWPEALAQVTR